MCSRVFLKGYDPLYSFDYVMIHQINFNWCGLVYWGLTPQQQPGSYQGGEMMMMKCHFHLWRKPVHPGETTDLREVTDFEMDFSTS